MIPMHGTKERPCMYFDDLSPTIIIPMVIVVYTRLGLCCRAFCAQEDIHTGLILIWRQKVQSSSADGTCRNLLTLLASVIKLTILDFKTQLNHAYVCELQIILASCRKKIILTCSCGDGESRGTGDADGCGKPEAAGHCVHDTGA
jgi:hypothetical protein